MTGSGMSFFTLWSPLQVIKLLEDSSEQATRLRKTSPLLSLLSDPERRQLLSLNFWLNK